MLRASRATPAWCLASALLLLVLECAGTGLGGGPEFTHTSDTLHDADAQHRPEFGLEISGGLRTFAVTWPVTLNHLIGPNGGMENFRVVFVGTYHHPTQLQMAHDALDIAIEHNFHRFELRPSDPTRTCSFYFGSPRCHFRPNVGNFPYQWESVRRAHDALLLLLRDDDGGGGGAGSGHMHIVRMRPDVLLFRPLYLEQLTTAMRAENKTAWLPCVFSAGSSSSTSIPPRAIDDLALGTPAAMTRYASWSPSLLYDSQPRGRIQVPLVAEQFVGTVLGNTSLVQRAGHALLDLAAVSHFSATSRYRTTQFSHARCARGRGVLSTLPKPYASLPRHNETRVQHVVEHVREAIAQWASTTPPPLPPTTHSNNDSNSNRSTMTTTTKGNLHELSLLLNHKKEKSMVSHARRRRRRRRRKKRTRRLLLSREPQDGGTHDAPAPTPPVVLTFASPTALAAEQEFRPFALEISGGLRTFTVAWPVTLKHLIYPNGGMEKFRVSFVGTYHPSQMQMAQDALDLAKKHEFFHFTLHPGNKTRTCLHFWPTQPRCVFHQAAQNFPYQWESVKLAHDALLRARESDLYLRMRPDVVLFRDVNLTHLGAMMRQQNMTGWLPCKFPRSKGKPYLRSAIDDLAMGTRETMSLYASWHPRTHRYAAPHLGNVTIPLVTEQYVGEVMNDLSYEELAYHALLDLIEVDRFTESGKYRSHQPHARCKTRDINSLPEPYVALPGVNLSHVSHAVAHVERQTEDLALPGLPDHELSVLLNHKYDAIALPQKVSSAMNTIKRKVAVAEAAKAQMEESLRPRPASSDASAATSDSRRSSSSSSTSASPAPEFNYASPKALAEAGEHKPYALELSGGMRTFTITWPVVYRHIIEPSGGLQNFRISLVGNYHASQVHIARDAVDIARRFHFFHLQLHPSNHSRTCMYYYANNANCTFRSRASNFPYQWESVGLAHRALLKARPSDFYLRMRPDVLLFKDLDLGHILQEMRLRNREGWLPCAFPRMMRQPYAKSAVDDMAGGTLAMMTKYAQWVPRSKYVTEGHVGETMNDWSYVETAAHAILDLAEAPLLMDTGTYFSHQPHARCKGKHVKGLDYRYDSLRAFNATHAKHVRDLVNATRVLQGPGLEDYELSVLLNHKYELIERPEKRNMRTVRYKRAQARAANKAAAAGMPQAKVDPTLYTSIHLSGILGPDAFNHPDAQNPKFSPTFTYRSPTQSQGRGSDVYVLELSGGLRTFAITWPITLKHLIQANGGREKFHVSFVGTYHASEVVLARDALDIATAFDFQSFTLHPFNKSRVCQHYHPQRSACTFHPLTQNFPQQWESVRLAHAAALALAPAPGGPEPILYIRMRPDVVLFQDVPLATLQAAMRDGAKTAWLPCTFPTETKHPFARKAIDDFVMGDRDAMDRYASWHPNHELAMDAFVGETMSDLSAVGPPMHALLDLVEVEAFVQTGKYHTSEPHVRCRPGTTTLPSAYTTYPGYNATRVRHLVDHVKEASNALYLPGLSQTDMSQLVNHKFHDVIPPKTIKRKINQIRLRLANNKMEARFTSSSVGGGGSGVLASGGNGTTATAGAYVSKMNVILQGVRLPSGVVAPHFRFSSPKARAEAQVHKPYALELSGGMRTFVLTWPITVKHVIERNGGLSKFRISFVGTYHESEVEIARDALEIATRNDFYHFELMTANKTRTCQFYFPGQSRCGFNHRTANFPYQWESVTRAHRALFTASRSDLYLRMRPDIVVLREFDLSHIHAKMRETGRTGWLPCTFNQMKRSPFPMMAIDDMAMGTLETMTAYATWSPSMDVQTEGFVGSVMFDISYVEPAFHAILDLLESVDFVASGAYHTRQTHSRCKTKDVEGLLFPYRSLGQYNETQVDRMKRHVQDVYASKFVPGMSEYDMSVLLNNKFEHIGTPKKEVVRFQELEQRAAQQAGLELQRW